jgi:hypothetical protein
MAEGDEELLFFSIHDADASGTLIHQALQNATSARPARPVKIIDLGLDVNEALEMDLPVETLKPLRSRRPVAEVVMPEVADWLQTHRVELNAMSTPEFIEWLDVKMADHGHGKVTPPPPVLEEHYVGTLREDARQRITEKVLHEAGVDQQVELAVQKVKVLAPLNGRLSHEVDEQLRRHPELGWREPVEGLASIALDSVWGHMNGREE